MRGCGLRTAIAGAVVLVVAVVVVIVVVSKRGGVATPGCTVTVPGSGDKKTSYTLEPEQMGYAATIAAVATKLELPAHAVTVALATALQESKLRNLEGGDRDSVGLFQQRPSQGWGTADQLQDPVYAATAFYQRLVKLPGWADLPVNDAAQAVQRSGVPDAYAQWESEARAAASALTGQVPAGLTCRNITVAPATASLATVAGDELGTSALSGAHPAATGWTISSWLVARAIGIGVDKVSYAGQTWTAASGAWTADPDAGAALSLHQVTTPPTS